MQCEKYEVNPLPFERQNHIPPENSSSTHFRFEPKLRSPTQITVATDRNQCHPDRSITAASDGDDSSVNEVLRSR